MGGERQAVSVVEFNLHFSPQQTSHGIFSSVGKLEIQTFPTKLDSMEEKTQEMSHDSTNKRNLVVRPFTTSQRIVSRQQNRNNKFSLETLLGS